MSPTSNTNLAHNTAEREDRMEELNVRHFPTLPPSGLASCTIIRMVYFLVMCVNELNEFELNCITYIQPLKPESQADGVFSGGQWCLIRYLSDWFAGRSVDFKLFCLAVG